MRRVLLVSVGLHGVALAAALLLRASLPPEPDEPPRIKVVFGSGFVSPAAAAASAAEKPAPPPQQAAGASLQARAMPAPVEPVRLAAPEPGLRVERPDPLMIPAQDADGNRGPDYPDAARRNHLQGVVLLRLHIGTDGTVTRVETLHSSGSAILDAAATAALARWHFLPAEQDGQPVVSYRDQPVEFLLSSEARSAW